MWKCGNSISCKNYEIRDRKYEIQYTKCEMMWKCAASQMWKWGNSISCKKYEIWDRKYEIRNDVEMCCCADASLTWNRVKPGKLWQVRECGNIRWSLLSLYFYLLSWVDVEMCCSRKTWHVRRCGAHVKPRETRQAVTSLRMWEYERRLKYEIQYCSDNEIMRWCDNVESDSDRMCDFVNVAPSPAMWQVRQCENLGECIIHI